MLREINWQDTLNSIVYTHEHSEVVFKIEDIEKLSRFVTSQNDTISKNFKEQKQLKSEIDELRSQILKLSLENKKQDYVVQFMEYA